MDTKTEETLEDHLKSGHPPIEPEYPPVSG